MKHLSRRLHLFYSHFNENEYRIIANQRGISLKFWLRNSKQVEELSNLAVRLQITLSYMY